jgi:hypothetical protein
VSTAPRYTEVERAIRSVTGVAEASVVQAPDSGRGRLRIRLHPGEDADRVSWSVAATLRERFGIALDPEEIRPSVSAEAQDNGHDTAVDGVAVEDAEAEPPPPQPPTPPEAAEEAGPGAAAEAADTSAPADGSAAPRADGPAGHAAPSDFGDAAGHAAPSDLGDAAAAPDFSDIRGLAGPAPAPGELIEELGDAAPPPPGHLAAPGSGEELAGSVGSARAVIRDLRSRTESDGVMVTATLDYSGRLAEGRSTGVPTTRGLLRTIAEATMMALGELTGQGLRAQVDRVSLAGCDPTTVTVVVTRLSPRGEELLLGASIVRDDVEHAVMRATLDAMNRRVQPDLTA